MRGAIARSWPNRSYHIEFVEQRLFLVMAGLSRSKNGVASLAYVRPSTSFYERATRRGCPAQGPGMTKTYHSGSLGSFSRTRRVVPLVASAPALACAKLHTTRGAE